jgi:hypothetical protein
VQKKKKYQSAKERVIANLRAENRRLKELSAALVDMYDMTKVSGIESAHIENYQMCQTPQISLGDPSSANHSGINANNSVYHNPLDTDVFQFEPTPNPVTFDTSQQCTQNNVLADASPNIQGYFPTLSSKPGFAESQASHQHDPSHLPTPHSYHLTKNHTPMLQTLPIPTSYDHLEPTFSRRLLRRCFQIGYHVLLHRDQFPLALLERIYGFCLIHSTVDRVIEKLKVCLGLGVGGEMVGDQLRWGRIPDRRDPVEMGGSGEVGVWMEANEVEEWLDGLGFCVAGKNWGEVERWGLDGERLLPQMRLENASAREGSCDDSPTTKAPIIPYGTVWDPSSDGAPDTEAVLRACFSASGPCINAGLYGDSPAPVVHVQNYLNVDYFYECLMQNSVCLGRTAGFRRTEIETILKSSLVKA